MVLDILVQSRRDTQAAKRLLCKLLPPSGGCASCCRQAAAVQAAQAAVLGSACHDHRPDMVAIQRQRRFSFEVRQPVQWRRIQPRA